MPERWPDSNDYCDAAQNPQTSFSDPELQQATAVTNATGLPHVCAGNFADVYQFQAADGKRNWAVKLFTRPVEGLHERYREISRRLNQAALPVTVGFEYLEQGVRIHGKWFPVVKMDWVAGQTLREFVEQNLDKPQLLEVLFQIWLRVEPVLRDCDVAHGDLQHGNVLIVPGSGEGTAALKLIDYDGLWINDLAQQPPPEVGHPNYQHPSRARQGLYNCHVDRFPHLVIACALRCLRTPAGTRLWEKHDNGENLLFTEADFHSPKDSALLRQLWTSGNRELKDWVGHLVTSLQAPIEATPLLADLCSSGRLAAPSETAARAVAKIFDGTAADQSPARAAAKQFEFKLTPPAPKQPERTKSPEPKLKESPATPLPAAVEVTGDLPPIILPKATRAKSERQKKVAEKEAEEQARRKMLILGGVAASVIVVMGLMIGLFALRKSPVAPTASPASPTIASSPGQSAADGKASVPDKPAEFRWLKTLDATNGGCPPVERLFVSGNGKLIASVGKLATDRPAVRCWDSDSLAEHALPPERSIPVRNVSGRELVFTPAGELLNVGPQGWDAAHSGAALGCAYALSSDGRWLLVAQQSGPIVELWDAEPRRHVRDYLTGTVPLVSLAFLRDGQNARVIGRDGTLGTIDLRTGILASLPRMGSSPSMEEGDPQRAGRLRLAASGERAFTVAARNKIIVWDAAAGSQIHECEVSNLAEESPVLSPNGRCLACCNRRGGIRLFDLEKREDFPLGPQDDGELDWAHDARLAFTPDGRRIVLGTISKPTLKVGELPPLECVMQAPPPASSSDLWFGSESIAAVVGQASSEPRRLTAPDGRELAQGADAMAFAPRGDRVVYSARDSLKLLTVQGNRTEQSISAPPLDTGALRHLVLGPKGQDAAQCAFVDHQFAGAGSARYSLLELETAKPVIEAQEIAFSPAQRPLVSLSPDGGKMVAAGEGEAVIWDTVSARQTGKWNLHELLPKPPPPIQRGTMEGAAERQSRRKSRPGLSDSALSSGVGAELQLVLAFSRLLRNHIDTFIVGAGDQECHFLTNGGVLTTLNAETGTVVRQFSLSDVALTHGTFSPDRRLVLLAPERKRVSGSDSLPPAATVYDTSTGTELVRLEATVEPITCCAISHDNHWAVTGHLKQKNGSYGETQAVLRLWNLAQGQKVQELEVEPKSQSREKTSSQSADGQTAARYAGFSGLNEQQLQRIMLEVEFSPDRSFVAARNFNREILIWSFGTSEKRDQKPADPIEPSAPFSKSLKVVRHFIKHKSPVNLVTVTPNGRKVASLSNDGELLIWELKTGVYAGEINLGGGSTGTRSKSSASSERRNRKRASGSSLDDSSYSSHSGQALYLACVQNDQGFFVTVSGTIARQAFVDSKFSTEVLSQQQISDNSRSKYSRVVSCVLTDRKNVLLVGLNDGGLLLDDLEKKRLNLLKSGDGEGRSSSTLGRNSESGKRGTRSTLGRGSEDVDASYVDQSAHIQNYFYHHLAHARSAPLAVALQHDSIVVWNTENGNRVTELSYERANGQLLISADGRRVVLMPNADTRNRFVLWDLDGTKSSKTEFSSPDKGNQLHAICLSPDGKLVVTAEGAEIGADRIRLWDLDSRQSVAIDEGNRTRVNSMAFSDDGQHLVSGGDDSTVTVWSVTPAGPVKE